MKTAHSPCSGIRPTHGRPRSGRLGAFTAAGITLASCRAPEPIPFVLHPPAVVIEQALEPGTSLGPRPAPASAGTAGEGTSLEPDSIAISPIPVRCRILYLRQPRLDFLKALGSDAIVVADLEGATAVLPTPELTLSTLYALGADATAWLAALDEAAPDEAMRIAGRSNFVPVGASSRLSVKTLELVEDPRDWLDEFRDRGPIPREVGIVVTGTGAGPRIALYVTDLDPEREAQMRESFLEDPSIPAKPPPPAQNEVLRREVLSIRHYPELDSPLVLHLDSPFSQGNGTSLAVIVEVLRPGDIHGAGEVEAVLELAETAAVLAAKRQPLTEESRLEIERAEALKVFQLRSGRSALLQVAQESDAVLAQDLALVADEDFLQALKDRAFPFADAVAQPVPIGWRLDAAAWNMLAERALEETLDPELMGVFYRRAGALAAFPDIVQDAVKAAKGSRTRFENRLITEQRYFLEDPSPSARLRAYDWLLDRGVKIPGFDPLGMRNERRAALEKAAESAPTAGDDQ